MSKKSKHSQEFRDTAVQLALKGDKCYAQCNFAWFEQNIFAQLIGRSRNSLVLKNAA